MAGTPSGTLRALWEAELQDLYTTEQRVKSALPELISSATSSELKTALDRHLQQTTIHIERLDLIFKQSGFQIGSKPTGIESLVRTGSETIRRQAGADVRDAAVISAAQHVEHYEMAGYGCARTWARELGEERAADLLQQTLDEEGEADHQLTDIAEAHINKAAGAGTSKQTSRAARLRYVNLDDMPHADTYRRTTIRNRAGDDLGKVDGFIVDQSGRPYYLVADAGGLFVGRRYVVPIGRVGFDQAEQRFTIDLDKDLLKRYPEFHRDAFLAMNDEEARRYEWRVLEVIDPKAARTSTREWDYEELPYYRQPDWFEPDLAASSRRPTRGETGAARAREERDMPIAGREGERVVAREHEADEDVRERERVRRGTPDERG
jgi:ferritin-like metal-binding protein YciE